MAHTSNIKITTIYGIQKLILIVVQQASVILSTSSMAVSYSARQVNGPIECIGCLSQ